MGFWSLFDPYVNVMERRPYCSSRMEVNYCIFGFGAIIRHDVRTLSLPRDSSLNDQYACVIWVHAGEATHAMVILFGGLSYKKIRRYNNSPPYVTARWPPQQIPPKNFLGKSTFTWQDSEISNHIFLNSNVFRGWYSEGIVWMGKLKSICSMVK